MTHAHLTTIVITLILFFVTVSLQKKSKNIKVLHMILRIFYLLIIATGGMLIFSVYHISFLYILKVIFGLIMIGFFEMILLFGEKRKSTKGLWIVCTVTLLFLIYLGLKLPMGLYF